MSSQAVRDKLKSSLHLLPNPNPNPNPKITFAVILIIIIIIIIIIYSLPLRVYACHTLQTKLLVVGTSLWICFRMKGISAPIPIERIPNPLSLHGFID